MRLPLTLMSYGRLVRAGQTIGVPGIRAFDSLREVEQVVRIVQVARQHSPFVPSKRHAGEQLPAIAHALGGRELHALIVRVEHVIVVEHVVLQAVERRQQVVEVDGAARSGGAAGHRDGMRRVGAERCRDVARTDQLAVGPIVVHRADADVARQLVLDAGGELVRVRPVGAVRIRISARLPRESAERAELAFLRSPIAVARRSTDACRS